MIPAMTIFALIILVLAVARFVILLPTRNPSVDGSLAHRVQSAADVDSDAPSDRWITA